MAGGKITRIVGGLNSIECESWTVYTDKFTAYANGGSHFTADKGTNFGDPDDPPSGKKYFEKGYWTDSEVKRIKEAKLGDTVQFHLVMRNIYPITSWEDENVTLELREFDSKIPNILLYMATFGIKDIKAHDKIKLFFENKDGAYSRFTKIKIEPSMKMVITISLDEKALIKYIIDDGGRNLELYFNFNYYSARNIEAEEADLPILESDFLLVKPPPLAEPIVFVEASDVHKFPAIYSAEDGSPWYVNILSPEAYKEIKGIRGQGEEVAGNIEIIRNFFKEDGSGAYEPEKITEWEKRAYNIAVRKLSKGELIFNDGTKGVSNRFHRYDVSDIDGRFSEQVLMGVNRGKFKSGVTSKGINQLEAHANRGIAKVFKTVGEINPLWDAICDVADILVAAANGERPPLPFTPPFVTTYINNMFDEMYEDFRVIWQNELRIVMLKGLKAVDNFLRNDAYNDKQSIPNLGFKIIELSEEGIRKILTKEIDCVNDKSNPKSPYMIESLPNIGEGARDSGILVQSTENKDKYGRLVLHHYIHAIFIKDTIV